MAFRESQGVGSRVPRDVSPLWAGTDESHNDGPTRGTRGMDNSLICTSKQTDPYGELKIFAGSASKELTLAVCGQLGVELAESETMIFSDGNLFVRVLENVRGRDVYVVQGSEYPVNDNLVELMFWIDAFRRASASQVTAVIPYFSYAKGDKKDEPRVSIRAGCR